MNNMLDSKPQHIDAEKLKRHLPKGTSHQVTDNILDMIARMENDIGLEQEYMEEQLLSNINVVKEMKISIPKYVDALKYCTLKKNMSNRKAWEIVFPERLAKAEALLAERAAEGRLRSVNIDSHVSNYNNSAIVVKIDTQMMSTIHIQYAPMLHESIMKQRELMYGIGANPSDRVSPTVQQAAATALYDMVKAPEDNSVELKIGISDESKSVQKGLMDQIARATDFQMKQLAAGVDIANVQRLGVSSDDIIEAEVE